MSLHASLSPELKKKLKTQQRRSALTSGVIAVLLVTLVGIILAFCLLPRIENFTPEIVSYQNAADKKDKVTKPKITNMVQRKPSSPSSSMARVIAATTASDIAVPVPENIVETPMDFGNGDDFGDGWGDGDGWGGGAGGGTTFFGQKLTGKRILYIIDYSQSMRGARQRLMRAELSKSVMRIPPDKKFQMIFFAGPVWVADSQIIMDGKKGATVKDGDQSYNWVSPGNAHTWKPEGKRQVPQWLTASDKQVEESAKIIKKSRLIWGTTWENPLAMAFTM